MIRRQRGVKGSYVQDGSRWAEEKKGRTNPSVDETVVLMFKAPKRRGVLDTFCK